MHQLVMSIMLVRSGKKMLHLRHLKLAMNTCWQYIDVFKDKKIVVDNKKIIISIIQTLSN
jgi:hypothetical protein